MTLTSCCYCDSIVYWFCKSKLNDCTKLPRVILFAVMINYLCCVMMCSQSVYSGATLAIRRRRLQNGSQWNYSTIQVCRRLSFQHYWGHFLLRWTHLDNRTGSLHRLASLTLWLQNCFIKWRNVYFSAIVCIDEGLAKSASVCVWTIRFCIVC